MSSNELVEIAVDLLEAKIKAEIAAALLDVRTDRADALVTTEVPRSYFIYDSAQVYRCPAVFISPKDIDFDKDLGANHINASVNIRIAVIVEDKDMRLLNKKAWRYQAALHKILNQAQLVSLDNKVKITTIVRGASFSREFTLAQAEGESRGMFQKEVALDMDCRHREGF